MRKSQLAALLCAAATAVPVAAHGVEPTEPTGSNPFVARSQHGAFVRGSVVVASAPSRLRVDVLARRAALGGPGAEQVVVGHHTDTLPAGRQAFAVELNSAAERAVQRAGKLAVKVQIVVKAASGTSFTATRPATLEP